MIDRRILPVMTLVASLCVLNACTSSRDYEPPNCGGEAFPGMCWNCIARSPEVVLVQRLNRGIDDHGSRIYATRLVDGSCIAMRGQDDSFGVAYLARHRMKDGVLRSGLFTVPDGSEPLGVVYVHAADNRYLAICHRERGVGLHTSGTYRLSNKKGKNHIRYEILRYQDQNIPRGIEAESFSIAEKGFCVDRDGTLLWPGDLEQGDVYDLDARFQENEEDSNGL